ncbi:MAG: TrkA family potassium uptake protein [Lentisphaeria bacterium]|nr:TrkA family potassium uptake protein [Lentisphaeria bacterium]
MQKQIAVIGLGIFGREVALSLIDKGFTVLAIDNDEEALDDIKDQVTETLLLDTTQQNALQEAEINQMDTVVVAIGTGHLENSILTTALLRQLGAGHIIARAANDLHERILRQVGAHEVINPEREMGKKVADRISRPGFNEYFKLPDGVCVAQLPIPDSFVEHTLEELNVRRRFNINVLGVQRLRHPETTAQEAPDNSGRQKEAKPAPPTTKSGQPTGQPAPAPVDLDRDDDENKRRMIMNISPNNDRFKPQDIILVMGHQDDLNRLLAEH